MVETDPTATAMTTAMPVTVNEPEPVVTITPPRAATTPGPRPARFTGAPASSTGAFPSVQPVAAATPYQSPPPTGLAHGQAPGRRRSSAAWLAFGLVAVLAAVAFAITTNLAQAPVAETRGSDDQTVDSAGGTGSSPERNQSEPDGTGGSTGGTGVTSGAGSAGDATVSGAPVADELPPETTWILVLHSVPKADGVEVARSQADLLGGDTRVLVIDSDDYPGLRGGYWVVVSHGYTTQDEARADCSASFGLTLGGACYDRLIG